jgi:hypothetical protein
MCTTWLVFFLKKERFEQPSSAKRSGEANEVSAISLFYVSISPIGCLAMTAR